METRNVSLARILTVAAPVASLLLWLYLADAVPYTHDDWDWGADVGLVQWLTGSLNGRFAGNFFVVAMTRAPLAKTLTIGLSMFALTTLMAALDRRPCLVALALALCLQAGWFVGAYHQVNRSSALREALIREAVEQGASTLTIPTERYKIWWGRNPQVAWRADYYRAFYGIPDEVTLIFLPAGSLDRWPTVTDADLQAAMIYPPA